MTDEKLEKALYLKRNIQNAKHFDYCCYECWRNFRIKNRKLKIKTAYGCISDEYEVPKELAEKLCKTIRDQIEIWEKELEEL